MKKYKELILVGHMGTMITLGDVLPFKGDVMSYTKKYRNVNVKLKLCKCGKQPQVRLKSGCIYQISCKKCKIYTAHYSLKHQAINDWNSKINRILKAMGKKAEMEKENNQ